MPGRPPCPTLDMLTLCTLDDLYLALDLATGDGYDTTLEMLRDGVSTLAERACGYALDSSTYKRWFTTSERSTFRVPEQPVSDVIRFCAGKDTALRCSCTTARSRVKVTSTAVVLNDGSDHSLTFAGNATLTAMVTAIDAVANWSATLVHTDGTWPSSDLRPRTAVPATTDDQAWLHVPEDAVTDGVILDDYDDRAIRRADGRAFSGEFFLEYTAGYATVPDDLKRVAVEICSEWWNRLQADTSVGTESVGGIATSRLVTQWSEQRDYLGDPRWAPWRRIRI